MCPGCPRPGRGRVAGAGGGGEWGGGEGALQRRDGDVAVLDGLEVRVRPPRPRHPPSPDPEDLAAPRVFHGGDLFVEHAAAQVRHLHALDLISGNGREVDVEQGLLGEILDAHDPLHEPLESFAVTLQMLEVEAAVRNRDARHAGRQTFHRRGNGARIQHVFSHVRPMVDSRKHPVGRGGHERPECQEHAVGGRAVHLECTVRAPMGPERAVQRQRVRRAALLAVGRHHGDLPDRGAHVGEQGDTRRQHTVIVGDQDPQVVLSSRHWVPTTTRPACRANASAIRHVSPR